MPVAQANNRQIQQVSAILRHLDQLPPNPDENRRQRIRVNIRLSLHAILIENPALAQIGVYTRNISMSGMGFISSRPFRPSELMAIHVHVGHQPGKVILCRTMFCRYIRGGFYEVGVAFEEAAPGQAEVVRIPNTWLARAVANSNK